MAAQIFSDKHTHLRDVRQHLRCLGNDRHINVAKGVAFGLNTTPGFAQQFAAVCAFKSRIGVREQFANVAQRGGTQQRVGQRMQRHVAIRMRQQTFFVRNAHAANDNWANAAKGVYIKTVSNTHYAFS